MKEETVSAAVLLDAEKYGRLRATDIVSALASLDADELRLVESMERAGRGRVTVLRQIDKLLGALAAQTSVAHPPGWWQGWDGEWYPPYTSPDPQETASDAMPWAAEPSVSPEVSAPAEPRTSKRRRFFFFFGGRRS